MVHRLTADLVVVVHVAFLVFVAVGGLAAWRRPRIALLHVPCALWAVTSIGVGLACPLTSLERSLRELAGDRPYAGGFVDHYLEGVVYPEAATPVLWGAAVVLVVLGYGALLRRAAVRRTGQLLA